MRFLKSGTADFSTVDTDHSLSVIKSLEEIQVTHVLGWINRDANLVVIEYNPSPFFVYMSNIMPTKGRRSYVAHYTDEPVSCKLAHE